MDIVLWIIAGLLALGLLAAGGPKIVVSREKLVAHGMARMADLCPPLVKIIGSLEILGAIGLVLPAAVGIAPLLVPLAAAGVVLLMVGAVIAEASHRDWQRAIPPVIFLVLAATVVWGRLGPYSFAS